MQSQDIDEIKAVQRCAADSARSWQSVERRGSFWLCAVGGGAGRKSIR